MIRTRLARLRPTLRRLFPTREIEFRTAGHTRHVVLSTRNQVKLAGAAVALVALGALAPVSMVAGAVALDASGDHAVDARARYERLIADRQARLDAAVAQIGATRGSVDELAADVESRHAALAVLMTELKDEPGAAAALVPDLAGAPLAASPATRIQSVRLDQDELIDKADAFARTRASRLRLAFKLAGVRPSAVSGGPTAGLGGPLVDARDPRALAAVLDVDEDFARRIQRVAKTLSEVRVLDTAATALPLGQPTRATRLTSAFGVRSDPFTAMTAFHSGQDFAGSYLSPVEATGPGVVSYAGVRSGYGNTVEVDHGSGFKTRYAHLASIGVRPGQRVALGHKLGGMGSTGRSTGVHLHYEVWVDGRAQNPARFLKAGAYVREG